MVLTSVSKENYIISINIIDYITDTLVIYPNVPADTSNKNHGESELRLLWCPKYLFNAFAIRDILKEKELANVGNSNT